ncbi:MAG: DUF2530 domain-containing protein [Actinomycetes bacterium]
MSPRSPDPQPLDVDGVFAVTAGTVGWAAAFLVLLAFRGELAERGDEWWLWTCLTGAGLGVLGLAYCVRRRNHMRRSVRRIEEEKAKTLREPLS